MDVGTALFSYRLDPALGMNRATQVDRSSDVLELTHEDSTIADTWLIAASAVYTCGLHPTLPAASSRAT